MNSLKYEDDYYGWAEQQSNYIKNGEFEKLDIEHLADEVLSLGNDEIRNITRFIEIFFMHKLKIIYQPYMHTRSWDLSVKISEIKYKKLLKKNPSLKTHLKEIINDAYEFARLQAAQETGLDEVIFPLECPWTVKDVFPEIENKYT